MARLPDDYESRTVAAVAVWMVRVAGEGELAVVADTPNAAARIVAEELVRAAHLRVREVPSPVAAAVLAATPSKRAEMLLALGDFHPPSWRKDTRKEERRLREYISLYRRIDDYVADIASKSPPLTPAQVRQIQRVLWPAVMEAIPLPPPPRHWQTSEDEARSPHPPAGG